MAVGCAASLSLFQSACFRGLPLSGVLAWVSWRPLRGSMVLRPSRGGFLLEVPCVVAELS